MGNTTKFDWGAVGGQPVLAPGFDWSALGAKPVEKTRGDPQLEIKRKYNLPEAVDLTKGFAHPDNLKVIEAENKKLPRFAVDRRAYLKAAKELQGDRDYILNEDITTGATQRSIKLKHGLPQELDLRYPLEHPMNKGVVEVLEKALQHRREREGVKTTDPLAFSAAFEEWQQRSNPPATGFAAGAARQAGNIMAAMTDVSQGTAAGAIPPGTVAREYAQGIEEFGPVGVVPILGPMAGAVARTARTDPAGAAGEAAVDVLALALPFLLSKAPRLAQRLDLRRITKGKTELAKAASVPAGTGGERGAAFTADLDLVAPDLAAIGREADLKTGGNARVGELATLVEARAGKLWNEGHKPMVERHATAPASNKPLLDAALAEISPEDRQVAPAAARAAESWARQAFAAETRTIRSMDDLIRRLNQEPVPERFGNVGKRVRQAALRAARAELDRALEQRGEAGVRDLNRRYGALANVAEELARRGEQVKLKEPPSAAELVKHPVRTILGAAAGGAAGGAEGAGVGAAAGLATDVASLVARRRAEPGALASRGLRRLASSRLEPEPMAPASTGLGMRGLLGAGATRLGGPGSTSLDQPNLVVTPAGAVVARDPKTGRFTKAYTAEPRNKQAGFVRFEKGKVKNPQIAQSKYPSLSRAIDDLFENNLPPTSDSNYAKIVARVNQYVQDNTERVKKAERVFKKMSADEIEELAGGDEDTARAIIRKYGEDGKSAHKLLSELFELF